eukprot:6253268-Amphidinium_carterae.1
MILHSILGLWPSCICHSARVPKALAKFLQGVGMGYWMDNPFHSWAHACDVLHTCWQCLRLSRLVVPRTNA